MTKTSIIQYKFQGKWEENVGQIIIRYYNLCHIKQESSLG